MSSQEQARPVGGHTVPGIATLMVTAFTIGTDFTGALLLVPSIESDLAADITTTRWVLNIYALSFAMCKPQPLQAAPNSPPDIGSRARNDVTEELHSDPWTAPDMRPYPVLH